MVRGHLYEPGEFFYPPAKSVQNGWVCTRCGKTTLLLSRWSETVNDKKTGSEGENE